MAQGTFSVGDYVRYRESGNIYQVTDVKPRKQELQLRPKGAYEPFAKFELATEADYETQQHALRLEAAAHRVEWVEKSFEDDAMKIVRDLRDMAEKIEREIDTYQKAVASGEPKGSFGIDHKDPLHLTEQIQHALAWGMANLGAYRLITTAQRVNEARAYRDGLKADNGKDGDDSN